MKTKWYSMLGLALVVCLGLAAQSPAKKPVKPPPDPEPELPFTYERFVIQDVPLLERGGVDSINDSGDISGAFLTGPGGRYGDDFAFWLTPDFNRGTNAYLASERVLVVNIAPFDTKINNNNHVIGVREYDDISLNAFLRAVLWDSGGTEFALWSMDEEAWSIPLDLNHAGLVTIGAGGNLYIVVPIDVDGDGIGDIWFEDNDSDGINDLACLVDTSGLSFSAINESGQVLFEEGYLLTPDFSILASGGNPWMDGAAAFEELSPLTGFEETYTKAYDLNDLGQIVGTSNGRAVIWDNSSIPEDLGKPTKRSAEIKAEFINNAGQIIGWCKDGPKNRVNFMIHEGQIYDLAELGAANYPKQLNNTGGFTSGFSIYIPVYPQP